MKHTPCDFGGCPFDARYGEDCRYHCGLGVDESSEPSDQPDYSEDICPERKDGQHHYIKTIHNGGYLYVCKYCGAAMPDPPEDTPPLYDHP